MKSVDFDIGIKTATELAKELMPKLPYHNFDHAIDVYSEANTLSMAAKIQKEDRFVLKSAALLHDVIVVPGNNLSEERSTELVRVYLPVIGYSEDQVSKIAKMIIATRMPQKPTNFLEELLCDADLGNLGRPDFLDQGEKVRIELGIEQGIAWYEQQLNFLTSHNYHTKVAKDLRNVGKIKNIERLKELITINDGTKHFT